MRILEIFWRFFVLGLSSFGGPAAHIGYFRQAFVEKRHWLDADHYHRLVALSQFLPGPGSSQVGFAIGLHRAGLAGGLSAFIAFTLPSFLLLYALALGIHTQQIFDLYGLFHGLKLLALIVVLDAILNMWQNFCTQRLPRTIALITTALLLVLPSFYTQVFLLLIMAFFGAFFLQPASAMPSVKSNQPSFSSNVWLMLALLLFALSFIHWPTAALNIFADFYQAGSLVFGGGHVVLPLLQQTLGEYIDSDSFLTAYAAAQAVPGPMFTLAAYLGAESLPISPLKGALIATLAIFLPGFLLVLALHAHWNTLANKTPFAGAMLAVNASVVGFLLAALIQSIVPGALLSGVDLLAAAVGFYLLTVRKISVFLLIMLFSAYGTLSHLIQTTLPE
ncbi:chromate efflux transporter [Thiomicrorhabdus sp.]|uniref:chromate efflux transporter n=1 Tax=Thiomicrorhabdus sp. TaxID=2039724 RepID=UPI0029C8C58A|nr:chromate efflux transporter [Thiomicrorhabdus sp.]